jgi:competence ComEA-like helix-hairpin-helix protein
MLRPIFHTVRPFTFFLHVVILVCVSACSTRTILTRSPHPKPPPASIEKVNINTADRSKLAALPEVGPALADKIIEHRTRHGPFGKIEHLMLIEGVSEKRYLKIRDLVTVR